MDGQLAVVLLLVAGAVFYLVRATWQTWSGTKGGCGKGCGCGKPASKAPADGRVAFIPSDQLTLRRRE